MKIETLQKIPVGTTFYFVDIDLQSGVNVITCYRRTIQGIRNLVTKRNSSFKSHNGLSSRRVVRAIEYDQEQTILERAGLL